MRKITLATLLMLTVSSTGFTFPDMRNYSHMEGTSTSGRKYAASHNKDIFEIDKLIKGEFRGYSGECPITGCCVYITGDDEEICGIIEKNSEKIEFSTSFTENVCEDDENLLFRSYYFEDEKGKEIGRLMVVLEKRQRKGMWQSFAD